MIYIKTTKEIEIMREGGKILAEIMKEIIRKSKPGVTTLQLDEMAENLIAFYRVKPAFKGYEGFKHVLCTSVNENIVHGVPSSYQLKEGDVLGLDLGILYKNYYLDMAITVGVGRISFEAQRLIKVAKKALRLAIKKARVGNTIGDIGNTIQRFVESQGFSVVRDLCGHGIGKHLHEDPKIPNFGRRGEGEKLKEGMVLCIEPMITAGDYTLIKSKDGFGYATKDGSLTAHFEHTIAILKDKTEVLTLINKK